MKRMYIYAIIFKQRYTSLQRVVSNFQTTIIIQTTIGSSTILKWIYQTENQTIYWPIANSLFVMYGFVVNKIHMYSTLQEMQKNLFESVTLHVSIIKTNIFDTIHVNRNLILSLYDYPSTFIKYSKNYFADRKMNSMGRCIGWLSFWLVNFVESISV